MCDKNCKYEAMTKEQTLAAIAQAIETGEIKDVDTGFVSKIKEQNGGTGLSFWVGTQAQYNAITEKVNNCFYIVTDDTTAEDIDGEIKNTRAEIEALTKLISQTAAKLQKIGEIRRVENNITVSPDVTPITAAEIELDAGTYIVRGWANFVHAQSAEIKIIPASVESVWGKNGYNDWETSVEVDSNSLICPKMQTVAFITLTNTENIFLQVRNMVAEYNFEISAVLEAIRIA